MAAVEMFYASGKSVDVDAVQAMIDSLDFYAFLVDEEHTIVLANRATAATLGKNPEDLIGGYCPKLIHGVDKFPGCPLEEAVDSGAIVEKLINDEQHNAWILSILYPLPFTTAGGKKVYFHTTRDVTEKQKMSIELVAGKARLEEAFDGLINALAHTVEAKDPYTASHQNRVSQLSAAIAIEYGLDDARIAGLKMAAMIHDIGKIYIPAEILNKPGKLSPLEFEIIKTHAGTGYAILKDIKFDEPVAEMVYQHHERINGSGYPLGLHDEFINEGAKIMAIADVVEAMSSDRPYRPGLGLESALIEIAKNAGLLYDEKASEICLSLFRESRFNFKPIV